MACISMSLGVAMGSIMCGLLGMVKRTTVPSGGRSQIAGIRAGVITGI